MPPVAGWGGPSSPPGSTTWSPVGWTGPCSTSTPTTSPPEGSTTASASPPPAPAGCGAGRSAGDVVGRLGALGEDAAHRVPADREPVPPTPVRLHRAGDAE